MLTEKPIRIDFRIEGLPKTTNSHRGAGHWARYKEDNKWKELVRLTTLAIRPPYPLMFYRLDLIRYSSSEPDYDGLVSSFKVIVDGMREAGILRDDKLSNTGIWQCHWFKAPPKKGAIRVVVTGYSEPYSSPLI